MNLNLLSEALSVFCNPIRGKLEAMMIIVVLFLGTCHKSNNPPRKTDTAFIDGICINDSSR